MSQYLGNLAVRPVHRLFFSFLSAVASNWGTLVTGGALIGMLGVFERWRNRPLSWRAYRWIAAGAVFVACYFSWLAEHDARNVTERDLKAAQDKSTDRQLSNIKLVQLQKFYGEAGPIIEANLPKDISTEDFEKWVTTAQAWADTTANWIDENLGPAAVARFTDRSGALTFSYSGAANPKHEAMINGLTQLRKNLATIIESRAWDAR
jgi:hypothetical protein